MRLFSLALILAVATPVTHAAEPRQQTPPDWSSIQTLKPGTLVTVRLDSGESRRERRLVGANASDLVVLSADGPDVPGNVRRVLLDIVERYAQELVDRRDVEFISGHVRISSLGLFDGTKKVAAFERVIEQIPRNDVAKVTALLRAHGSAKAAVGGAAGGFGIGLGVLTLLGLGEYRCGSGCGQLQGFLFLVPPIAGALIGYHAGHHDVWTVVYDATL